MRNFAWKRCDRACTAKKRALETLDEALCRQEQDREPQNRMKIIPKENGGIGLQ